MRTFQGANPFDQLTPAVKGLLIANVVMYLLKFLLPSSVVGVLALTPVTVLQKFWIWQIVTYAFVPPNGLNLFFNVLALWFCGPHIEQMWGTRRFLRYYFLCVIGAAAAQFLLAPETRVMGPSGGIYGILIAFGLLFPDAIIYLFFVFPVPALMAVLFIAALMLVTTFSAAGIDVAQVSHLGGMLTGFLLLKAPDWGERLKLWQADRRFRHPRGSGSKRRTPITEFEVHDPFAEMAAEVDRILDKISVSGVDSLSDTERETMRKYGERKK